MIENFKILNCDIQYLITQQSLLHGDDLEENGIEEVISCTLICSISSTFLSSSCQELVI